MMQHDVIIACDFKSAEDTFKFLDLFRDEERKPFLKIGMELFYAEGPAIVREIKRRGHRIFLDLKLHDIPNTVKKAMAVLSRLDVDMCNVHAAGTVEMMKYALEGLGARSLRKRVPDRHARRAFCRRRRCGPSARHHARPCAGDRLRLHRRGPSDHRRCGPRGRVPQVRKRILRLNTIKNSRL